MDNVKGLSFLAKCEECGQGFEVTPQILKNKKFDFKEENTEGKSIWITYYDCPNCGKTHMVQVDDEKSKQMLTKVSIMFAQLTVAKRKGKKISKKTSGKFEKARNDLSSYRKALMKELTGKHVYDDEAGCFWELRFSV